MSSVIRGTINTGSSGGGASTVADGADAAEGATTDVAVVGDNAGTLSAKLRGINKILNDVWDSVNHWLKVSIQNTTLAVTQSGTWAQSQALLTGSAPATATIAATSGQALASNGSRKAADLINTDNSKVVYLGFGANAAVVGSGIALFPNASVRITTTQAVNAIGSAAGAIVGIQEWT